MRAVSVLVEGAGATVGATAARQLFPYNDPIGENIQIGTKRFASIVVTVIGVLEPTGLRAGSEGASIMRLDPDVGVYFPYTLAKSEDNAPITSVLSVQGDTGGRSNPASLDTDKGPNILDQRHTFIGSVVAQPQLDVEGVAGAILNHNLFGIAMQFASGIPVTLRSTGELNNDAIGSDRPVGVTRNSYRLPARYNVDLRYSRLFPIGERMKLEFIAESTNVFNRTNVVGMNSTATVDAAGNVVAWPELSWTAALDQRLLQLGFRVSF